VRKTEGNRGGFYRRPAAGGCENFVCSGREGFVSGREVGLERWIRVERTAGIRIQPRHADRGAMIRGVVVPAS
jgi:hypothetical protein